MIRLRSRLAAFAAITLIAGLGACGDDLTGGDQDDLVNEWDALLFEAGEDEFIADGMDVRLDLNSDGSYSLQFTNDLAGACDGEANCTLTGAYTSSETQITLDPGTDDAVTFTYEIDGEGDNMTWAGTLGDIAVEIHWEEAD